MSLAAARDVNGLFDDIAVELRTRPSVAGRAVSRLDERLTAFRSALSFDDWRTFVFDRVRRHEITRLIHEAPITRRAFEKPRRYAGDAVTLDYIYGAAGAPPGTSTLGEALFEYERHADAARAIRARRNALAEILDEVMAASPSRRIASVACGHLREAQKSAAAIGGRFETFVAFDQDGRSLEVIGREQPRVSIVQGTVRQILAGKVRWSDMDLIYSAGLYDYLSDSLAAALTERLFGMLKPGGRLVIANVTPDLRNIAYMEALMDWWLIYRDVEGVQRVVSGISALSRSVRFIRPDPGVLFVEVTR